MSDITYTRITPAGEEKCSLLNGEGMTIEEMRDWLTDTCDETQLSRTSCSGCPYEGNWCKDYYIYDCSDEIVKMWYDDWTRRKANEVNFVKANPDDEVKQADDAINSGLADSGTRREFASGAVRDVAEGKGRCDLLPLFEVSQFLRDSVIRQIDEFVSNGNASNIYGAIELFCNRSVIGKHEAILEVAKHFEAGCKKYGERNWEKGIPIHCYIDSGVRHYLKHKAGYTDEPHGTAFLWNMLCLLWTLRNKPELNDLPWAKEAEK